MTPSTAPIPAPGGQVKTDSSVFPLSQSPADDRDNPSLVAIRYLRRVVELVAEHGDDEIAAWFVAKAAEYEASAHVGFSFDETLGLKPTAAGCRSWFTVEALDRRDRLLRLIASLYYAGRSCAQQADLIATALARYEAGADWRKDRSFAAPPAAYRGTERELLFGILRCGSAPAARTIRRVLEAVH